MSAMRVALAEARRSITSIRQSRSLASASRVVFARQNTIANCNRCCIYTVVVCLVTCDVDLKCLDSTLGVRRPLLKGRPTHNTAAQDSPGCSSVQSSTTYLHAILASNALQRDEAICKTAVEVMELKMQIVPYSYFLSNSNPQLRAQNCRCSRTLDAVNHTSSLCLDLLLLEKLQVVDTPVRCRAFRILMSGSRHRQARTARNYPPVREQLW